MGERLKGRNAVVTGAGRGIGRAVALALAEEGANVVICDLGGAKDGSGTDMSPAGAVVEECKKLGVKAVANYGDVSDWNQAEAMIKSCVDNFGRIDILCNIAGIDRTKMIWNMAEEDWDVVIGVHLKGTFNLSRHACVLMRQQRYGRIINCVSDAFAGTVGHCNYGAAKGGIASLTYAIAREMGRYGVTCNVFVPMAKTRFTFSDEVVEGLKKRVAAGVWTQEKFNETMKEITAEPEMFTSFIAYLASDAAADINGCLFQTTGTRVGIWRHPAIATAAYRDWEKEGRWTIEEIEKIVPEKLLKEVGYVNPAPPEKKKE